MKLFLYLTILSLLPSLTYADELDVKINKACLRHAISLVARLKSEVVGDLTQNQTDQALKLATDSCQAYFAKEFSASAIAKSNTEKMETTQQKESGDPLTDKWFESADKPGNKRLKRRN